MLRRAEPENVMDCDLPCRSPAREELTEDAARRAVPHLPGIHELKTAIAARRGMSEDNLQRYDELMDASDAVVDLVRSATVLRIRIKRTTTDSALYPFVTNFFTRSPWGSWDLTAKACRFSGKLAGTIVQSPVAS